MTEKDSKQLSEERYSQFAENYVTSAGHAKGFDLDRLVSLAKPQPTWQMLDIATGGGHTALKFAPLVETVIASDLTPQMLTAAEAFIRAQGVENVQFRQADAENLPFTDQEFDLVTCRIAPHHFPDVVRFVGEVARVLKPGGMFLLQDHVLPDDDAAAKIVDGFEKLRDPSHHRAYSETEWHTFIINAGLQIKHSEEIVKRHVFLPWSERQGNDKATQAALLAMLTDAPETALKWMEWQAKGTPEASFVNHHIIIKAIKSN